MDAEKQQEADRMIAQGFRAEAKPAAPAPAPAAQANHYTVNWRALDDNRARSEWVALRSWVEWMTVRYNVPLVTVPDCWWMHSALVEELSALHAAHCAAFDEADAGFGPLNWHERFATAQARLSRAYSGGCSSGHRSLKPRSWSDTTDEDEWDAWANQAHADPPARATTRKEG